jgi:hypothetical protein
MGAAGVGRLPPLQILSTLVIKVEDHRFDLASSEIHTMQVAHRTTPGAL